MDGADPFLYELPRSQRPWATSFSPPMEPSIRLKVWQKVFDDKGILLYFVVHQKLRLLVGGSRIHATLLRIILGHIPNV